MSVRTHATAYEEKVYRGKIMKIEKYTSGDFITHYAEDLFRRAECWDERLVMTINRWTGRSACSWLQLVKYSSLVGGLQTSISNFKA